MAKSKMIVATVKYGRNTDVNAAKEEFARKGEFEFQWYNVNWDTFNKYNGKKVTIKVKSANRKAFLTGRLEYRSGIGGSWDDPCLESCFAIVK